MDEVQTAYVMLIDCFELGVQFASAVTLHELARLRVRSPELIEVAGRLGGAKLNIGDWFDIFRRLIGVESKVVPPLTSEFRRKLEGPRGRTAFGKIFDTVPNLRNKTKGHNPVLSEAEARAVLEEYEPCLLGFVECLAPLSQREFFTCEKVLGQDDAHTKYFVRDARGLVEAKSRVIKTPKALLQHRVYMVMEDRAGGKTFAEDDLVELLPLVVRLPDESREDGQRFVYVFQSTTDRPEVLAYVSPEGRKRATGQFGAPFAELIALFTGGALRDRSAKPSKRKVAWPSLVEAAAAQSREFLGNMHSKYDRELFVSRASIDDAVRAFIDHPDRRGFALLGSSGSGKTCTLCHLTESMLDDGHLVATFFSGIFRDREPGEEVAAALKSKQKLATLLPQVDRLAKEAGKKAIFVFDAINECAPSGRATVGLTPPQLIDVIDRLLVKRELSSTKIIVSCRVYTWEEAQTVRGHTLGVDKWFTTRDLRDADPRDVGEIQLGGFTEAELDVAYAKYAERFEIATPLETLRSDEYRLARHQLRDPYHLRLASDEFAGRALPKSIDTTGLLQKRLVSDLPASEKAILPHFTAELRSRGVDALSISMDLVPSLPDDPLRRMMLDENDEPSPALRGLLAKGVLRMETATTFNEIRFVYDRDHEFLLSDLILRDVHRERRRASAELLLDELRTEPMSEVHLAAVELAINRLYSERRDADMLHALAASGVHGAQSAVVGALVDMAEESYPAARDALNALLHTPAAARDALARVDDIEDALKGGSDDALTKERSKLQTALRPTLLAKRTAVRVLYELHRSPALMEALRDEPRSPSDLLLDVLQDAVADTRDAAGRAVYYLWSERPELAVELVIRVIENLTSLGLRDKIKMRILSPPAFLSALFLADGVVTGSGLEHVRRLRGCWSEYVRSLPGKGRLLDAVQLPVVGRPIAQALLRLLSGGVESLSKYVNNRTEYEHFFLTVPQDGEGYTRESYRALVEFLDPDHAGFDAHTEEVVAGLFLGDAFNNLLLERVLIAQGTRDFDRIAGIVDRVFRESPAPVRDYMQMSMLYVLFHTFHKSDDFTDEQLRLFEGYMITWLERCGGYFYAHRNEQAAGGAQYTQYVLNWYGALHAKKYGDGKSDLEVFRTIIEQAIAAKSPERLRYAVDNIAMLAADFGHWQSALDLYAFTLAQFRSADELIPFDTKHGRFRTFLAETLATIRGYFARQVDRFVAEELAVTAFGGFETFREEVLRHDARETTADLLTHRIGNLFVHGIVHDAGVREHIQRVLRKGSEQNSVNDWMRVGLLPYVVDDVLRLR